MDQDIRSQRISVVVHTIFGFIAGYISLYFTRFWYALGASIILLLVVGFVSQKTFGKGKDRKWWAGNGAVIYLLIWIMAWILLFNLLPVSVKII